MGDKPRQWWIHFTRNIQDETFVHESDPECDLACDVVRVVEASAYDALATENERLREALVKISDSPCETQSFEKRWCCQFRHWAGMVLKRGEGLDAK